MIPLFGGVRPAPARHRAAVQAIPRRGGRNRPPYKPPGSVCRSLQCSIQPHGLRDDLRPKSRALRPGWPPKRACGRSASIAPYGRGGSVQITRNGKGPARCRTPPSPAVTASGLRCPHHAARAEARLHSATAAPAPSRCIRRRRRSTPQPLTGEASEGATTQSLPCKGRWMRRKPQTEGCIAAPPDKYRWAKRRHPPRSGRAITNPQG